jgi:uncharacterized protein (TIGR00251 family)
MFHAMSALPPWATMEAGALLIRVKAVPGASRDAIAGALGDRLKIRVSAPPEGGKANDAIIRLLSKALQTSERSITLLTGPASPMKTFRVDSVNDASLQALIHDAR